MLDLDNRTVENRPRPGADRSLLRMKLGASIELAAIRRASSTAGRPPDRRPGDGYDSFCWAHNGGLLDLTAD
jgi:hypothetical protein